MLNIKSIIKNHTLKTLNNAAEIEESCKCRSRNNCPLQSWKKYMRQTHGKTLISIFQQFSASIKKIWSLERRMGTRL